MQELYSIVVLISGEGTNLQALIDASHRSSYKISAVISNTAKAIGLNRAKISGIDTYVIEQESFNSKLEFEESLAIQISEINPKLIVLAGFMKVLSPQFVKLFRGKVINIHPSLLPEYPGLNTHQRVLEDKKKMHAAGIHRLRFFPRGGRLSYEPYLQYSKIVWPLRQNQHFMKDAQRM